MITISLPYVEHRDGESFLYSRIIDESRGRDALVWFSVNSQYSRFLCDETADAFVLLMLQLAMSSGQDLKVESPVSARLLFNIENTLQPLFAKAMPWFRPIKVMPQSAVEHDYQGIGVGCGCSLGVDSFTALLRHLSPQVPECYRVTHLALFNCGQLGDFDHKGVEENFHRTIAELEPFAKEMNLPLVAVNSNLNELYIDSDVKLLQSFVNRTICCALALQKLFGKYVYASSYSVEQSYMSPMDESYMETVFVPLLGTESTEVILSPMAMNRVEKTAYLSQYDITYRYLDVCWAAQMKYGSERDAKYADVKTMKNCGMCSKCMRTLLTLDILGKIDNYKDLFDIDQYYKRKQQFICTVVRMRDCNVFWKELTDLIKQTNYPIPFKAKVLCYDGFWWKVLRAGRRSVLTVKSLLKSKHSRGKE